MLCLLKVSPFTAVSCSGAFPMEYPTRLILLYGGLCLPPETTRGSGPCRGGWWTVNSCWCSPWYWPGAAPVALSKLRGTPQYPSYHPLTALYFKYITFPHEIWLMSMVSSSLLSSVSEIFFAAGWWVMRPLGVMRWCCAIDFWRNCGWSYKLTTYLWLLLILFFPLSSYS